MSEICRNCGKEIQPFTKMSERWHWTHVTKDRYYKYCYDIKDNPSTWDINKKAEPLTKNDIVYAILKEI